MRKLSLPSTEEFVEVIKQTTLHQKVPFNFDSDFVKMYFGKERKRAINYVEFSQFLHVSHPHGREILEEGKGREGGWTAL